MFLVILAQSAATSRAYAVKYQERFVENDDLVGLSAANLAAGLSGTFVVNGSPTKTEMVDEAKSHTQVAQLTTAAVVAIVLLFLTKPLQYLPNAVLAAVVFLIGLKLIEIANMREIWRLRKDEFAIAALTAIVVVVVGVEQGIILAIVLSVILHVRRHYTPHDRVVGWDAAGKLRMAGAHPGHDVGAGSRRSTASPSGSSTRTPSASPRRSSDSSSGPEPPRWFVLDAVAIDDVDYTGGQTLAEIADQLAKRKIVMAIAEASPQLRAELDRFGVTERIGADHYYDGIEDAREAFRASERA